MFRSEEDAALARAIAAHEQLEPEDREDEPVPTRDQSAESLHKLARRYEAQIRRPRGLDAPTVGQPIRPISITDVFPWRSYTIETSLSRREVAELFRGFLATHMVLGEESDRGDFSFYRRISYRNSFLPIVKVRVERGDDRTKVHVKMRLHWFVAAFMVVWMTLGLGGIGSALMVIVQGDPGALVALIFPLFGWALCGIAFGVEARKMDKMLFGVLPPPDLD